MNELDKAVQAIDFHILKNADKKIFESYTLGQRTPKINTLNDLDYFLQLNKSFFTYYNNLINQLPEQEQGSERMKYNLALSNIESAIKILSFNKNILDENQFVFYNIAYVTDIIKRNSGTDNGR